MKKVSLEDAVGQSLGHDLTEIVPDRKIKHARFKRGHIITHEDIEILKNIGKNHIFVNTPDMKMVHEDEAARIVSPLVAGDAIRFDSEPVEGKISFYAEQKGLLKIDVPRLNQINALEIPSLPTLFNNSAVMANQQVAAFRIIPLTCESELIDDIKAILKKPLVSVLPYQVKTAGIIVTGNEVFEGRIKDGFIPKLTGKLQSFQVEVTEQSILPDNRDKIGATLKAYAAVCDLVFITGGTSVDPDDQTVAAMRDSGVVYATKGNPIQPGNNLTIGSLGETCVCAIPAATLHFKATALDVFLPRLLAGDDISREEIAQSGHGGLCLFCKTCHFPVCPFAVTH